MPLTNRTRRVSPTPIPLTPPLLLFATGSAEGGEQGAAPRHQRKEPCIINNYQQDTVPCYVLRATVRLLSQRKRQDGGLGLPRRGGDRRDGTTWLGVRTADVARRIRNEREEASVARALMTWYESAPNEPRSDREPYWHVYSCLPLPKRRRPRPPNLLQHRGGPTPPGVRCRRADIYIDRSSDRSGLLGSGPRPITPPLQRTRRSRPSRGGSAAWWPSPSPSPP